MCTGTFDIRDAYEAVSRRLRQGADFTALFAIADSMAIGAMRALRDAGRRVPEDCSVIAIDGLELSAYIEPPLTTLCQPMEEMGRRSIQILLDMIEGRSGNCHEVLPTVLRPGGSVKHWYKPFTIEYRIEKALALFLLPPGKHETVFYSAYCENKIN